MKFGYMISGGPFDEVCVRTGTVDAGTSADAAFIVARRHARRRMRLWAFFGKPFGAEPPVSRMEDLHPVQQLVLPSPFITLQAWALQDDGHADRIWIAPGRTGDDIRRLLPLARSAHKLEKALDKLQQRMPRTPTRQFIRFMDRQRLRV